MLSINYKEYKELVEELEEIKQAEIANIIGISEVNVRVKIHRIKKELTEIFKENARLQ